MLTIPPEATPVCVACFKPITRAERHFYECRCEQCEIKLWYRVNAWRHGKPDAELDIECAGVTRF